MSPDVNQTPEQLARDRIDERLRASGWHVQDKDALDFNAGLGVAVREYQTDIGPADYVLFADRHAVGVVEAKPDNWGVSSHRTVSLLICFVLTISMRSILVEKPNFSGWSKERWAKLHNWIRQELYRTLVRNNEHRPNCLQGLELLHHTA